MMRGYRISVTLTRNGRRAYFWYSLLRCRDKGVVTWNEATGSQACPDRWREVRCERWLHLGSRHV